MQISNILSFWQNLVKNPRATFEKEKSAGDLVGAAVLVLVVAFVSGIITFLGTMVFGKASLGYLITGVLISIAVILVCFFIWSGVLFILAKLFGGKGNFKSQSYLIALVYTLSVISAVLGLIPILGQLIGLVLSLYMLYLVIVSIQVAHGLDFVKAALTVIIHVAIIFVLMVVVFAAMFATLFGTFGAGAAA